MSQEQRTRQHEGILAHYAARNDYSIAMLEAVLEAGKTALQSLLIINGGAVVALLGVLSNLAGKPEGSLLARYLAMPLLQFGVAVLLGALGFAFRYFSQACYAEMPEENSALRKWGHGLRYSAITCAVIGYLLFGIAIVNSYHGVVWAFAAR